MSLAELTRDLGRPGSSIGGHEVDTVKRFSMISQEFLIAEYTKVVSNNKQNPLTLHYSSDCTPLTTTESILRRYQDTRVLRKGRDAGEWLTQRLFIKGENDNRAVVMNEAQDMARKTGWAHYSAWRSLAATPRELGHDGLEVMHSCFDRAACPTARFIEMRHKAVALEIAAERGEAEAEYLELQRWHTTSACSWHDVHGSHKKAVLQYAPNPEDMQDAWAILESLRDCFSQIADAVPLWLPTTLKYRDWALKPEIQSQIWTSVGLTPDLVEELTIVQLRMEGDSLCVAESLKGCDDVMKRVEVVLLRLWTFKEWSDSRFGAVGSRSRDFMVALLSGVVHCVKYARHNNLISAWHVKCIDKLTPSCVAFFSVAAFSGHLPDAVLGILQEDDRLPLLLRTIDDEMSMEFEWLTGLPLEFWQVWADLGSVSARGLRSTCLEAACCSGAYMQWRFKDARKPPWHLGDGDVSANLHELLQSPPPDEDVCIKIWTLGNRHGWEDTELLEGINLYLQHSWSSQEVEKGHIYTSRVLTNHKGYGKDTLCARGMLGQMGPLLSQKPEAKRLQREQDTLTRLCRMMPQKLNAKAAFVSDLLLLGQEKRKLDDDLPADLGKRIVRQAGGRWKEAAQERKERYETIAEEKREVKRQKIEEKKEVARDNIASIKNSLEGEVDPQRRMCMSSCAFGKEQVEELQRIWDSDAWPASRVAKAREVSLQPVTEPANEVKDALENFARPRPDVHRRPLWLGAVCQNPSYFRDCIIRTQDSVDEERFLKIAYVHGNPHSVSFLPVATVEQVVMPAYEAGLEYWERLRELWTHEFDVEWGTFVDTDDWPFTFEVQPDVLKGCVFTEGTHVATMQEWATWEHTLTQLDRLSHTGRSADSKIPRAAAFPPEAWKAEPWVWDLLEEAERKRRAGGGGHPGDGGGSCGDRGPLRLDDAHTQEEIEDVFEQLWAHRAAVADVPGGDTAFRWTVFGGQWTKTFKGVAADAYKGMASTAAGRLWAARYQLQSNASFSLRRYGEADARAIVTYWTDKMNFLYDQAVGMPDPFGYGAPGVRAFQGSEHFDALLAGPPGPERERCVALADMQPVAPR
jgi:hypothetical protein